MFIQIQVEMTEYDTYEQYLGNAQRYSGNLYLAKHNAERDDKRQNKYGVRHPATPQIGVSLKEIS